MNKTLTYLLSGTGLLLSQVVCGQTLARGMLTAPQGITPAQAAAVPQSLRHSLQQLETRYSVSILADAQLLEGKTTGTQPTGKLEDALRALLKPHGLSFDKIDERIYVVVGKGRGRRREAATQPMESTLPVTNPQPAVGKPEPDAAANRLNGNGIDMQPTDRSLTGRVTTETGDGLPGVSVLTKGTTRGTTTDGEGRYRLSIPDGEGTTLVFSFVGYLTQEVAVGKRSTLDVRLLPDDKSLGEVVVVGYGTVKKSDVTGAVAQVGETNIKATPIVALDRAMQGRAAGVLVTQGSARPGGNTAIRIRGTGSVNAGNEPLYVIDGFPTTAGNLNAINSGDIESIEILKDASATAIYGSRGSNGVVLVTTKRGKAGQSGVEFDSYYGVQTVRRQIPLLNAQQYAEFINEARVNGGGKPYFDGSSASQPQPSSLGAGTDWQQEVFRTAPIQNYQLAFTGGETKTRYAISGGYYDQQGIVLNSYFKRYSLRANLDREVASWLRIGLSMQVAHTRANSARTESGGGPGSGVTNAALNFAPVFPVFNANGTYYRDLGPLNGNIVDNPVGIAREVTDQLFTGRVLANTFADLTLLKGLTFRTTLGADLYNTKGNFYVSRLIGLGASTNGSAAVTSGQNLSWLNENTLTYARTYAGKHNLTALLGYTAQGYHNEFVTASALNFNTDFAQFNNLGAGATLQAPASGANDWALVSYLARVNYGFADRWLLTLSARRDGSSRFGPNNKYGFFPSGALAWRLINERFMQNQTLFSDLKLRASYGLTGNQEIGDYRYLSAVGGAPYPFGGATPTLQNGGTPGGISNLDLRWEKSAQFNAGVDLSVLNNRVQFTADYYVKTTSDLLFLVNVPFTTGYGSSLQNIGKVENRGWELGINTTNVNTGGLRWTTELNLSANKNKILALDGRPEFVAGDGAGHLNVTNPVLMKVGEPLNSFYGRVVDGIFQNQAEVDASAQKTAKPGDFRYQDLNADGVINDNDRTIIGNGYPKLFGGINNTLTYRGIDLNFFFQGTLGNDILNYGRFDLYNLNGNNNQSADVLNRWTPTNPSNTLPRANSAGGQRILSTFHIEDGSYLRLKNLSLGYSLPGTVLKRFALRSARVYVAAQNWLTLTRYTGYDPEVSVYGTSSISQGMDYGGYPTAKTLLVGLNLKF